MIPERTEINNDAEIQQPLLASSAGEGGKRKPCPKCQFFIALSLFLVSSIILSFFFNVFPGLVNQGSFQVTSASSFKQGDSVVIDADLKISFPEVVVEALENGIPLTIAVDVQVLRERKWWRNIIIKESKQLFELRYHPLTNVHEIKNIASDERYTFNSRQDAMAALGTIRRAHLIEQKDLSKNQHYLVQMRLLLDISRLPPALRQIASLSPDWRLESAWYRWDIQQQNKRQVGPAIDNESIAISPNWAQTLDKIFQQLANKPTQESAK